MSEIELLLLEVEHILHAHTYMIELHGGAPGILNQGLVESIVGSVAMATQYEEMSVFQIAAKYGYKLVKNHCFQDGNKRVGAYVSLTYLRIHGIQLSYSQEEALKVFLDLAQGDMGEPELAEWFESKAI